MDDVGFNVMAVVGGALLLVAVVGLAVLLVLSFRRKTGRKNP